MERTHRITGPLGQPLSWATRAPALTDDQHPPLLLIHGLASNASRYEELVHTSELAEHHRLIRVDLRGHGQALTRRPVGMAAWCADLVTILQAEGHRPAIVVGHSLGAQVALHLAAHHREWVNGLVLIDPVFRRALKGRSRRIAQAEPLWRLLAALVRGLNAMGLHRGALPPLDLRQLDRQARQALLSPETEAAFIAQYSSTWADLRHVPTSVYLADMVAMCKEAPLPRTLQVPTLALLSSGATFADTTPMQEALAGPLVDIEAIECHHWPLTERPQAVAAAIEAWCERQREPTAHRSTR